MLVEDVTVEALNVQWHCGPYPVFCSTTVVVQSDTILVLVLHDFLTIVQYTHYTITGIVGLPVSLTTVVFGRQLKVLR